MKTYKILNTRCLYLLLLKLQNRCVKVVFLLTLSDKYRWERYKHLYSPYYGLDSATIILL